MKVKSALLVWRIYANLSSDQVLELLSDDMIDCPCERSYTVGFVPQRIRIMSRNANHSSTFRHGGYRPFALDVEQLEI